MAAATVVPADGSFQSTEVWYVDLRAAAAALHAIEQRTPRLSESERSRGAEIKSNSAAHDWLAAHIALRLIIERAFGRNWRGVPYRASGKGKPVLPGVPGSFSLSHVADRALIGVAAYGPIGVDLECRRVVRIARDRRAAIEAAAAALADRPLPEEPDARFLLAWARLESVAKASGDGIGKLLHDIGLGGRLQSERRAPQIAPRSSAAVAYAVHDLEFGEGLFAAAALAPGRKALVVCELPSDVAGLERLVA